MIKGYTGVPGAGKSLHSIKIIIEYLQAGKNVIANFPIKVNEVYKNKGHYYYLKNADISVDYLKAFANNMHRPEQENQTLIIIDEASVKFNCRTFGDSDRMDFLQFFPQHRKYGFEVVLIAQNLRQIDRQIRDLVELEVIHRKLNNFSLWQILPFSLFVAIERNNTIKAKNGHNFFTYNRKIGNLYDTYYDFTIEKDNTSILKINQDVIKKTEIKKEPVIKKRFFSRFRSVPLGLGVPNGSDGTKKKGF